MTDTASRATGASTGVEIVGVGYQCRCCGASKQVYVSPRQIDGERYLCPVNHRLHLGRCGECETQRTHVLDHDTADDAYDRPPIAAVAHEEGELHVQ